MAVFRILHISDLHICWEANRRNLLSLLRNPKNACLSYLRNARHRLLFPASFDLTLAESVARFAYEHRRRYDFIYVTGDVATTGLREDLLPAFDFVSAPVREHWWHDSGRPTLQGAGRDVLVIPGNHDRYADNFGKAGGNEFDAVFSRYWRNTRTRVQYVVKPKAEERLAVVAVDMCLSRDADASTPTMVTRYGQGVAYRARVGNLERATRRLRDRYNDITIIWVMHFPPMFSGTSSGLGLRFGDRVVDAAQRMEIELILAGHMHVSTCYELRKSKTLVACAGTATSVDCGTGNTIHLIEIEVKTGRIARAKRLNYGWSRPAKEFIFASEDHLIGFRNNKAS